MRNSVLECLPREAHVLKVARKVIVCLPSEIELNRAYFAELSKAETKRRRFCKQERIGDCVVPEPNILHSPTMQYAASDNMPLPGKESNIGATQETTCETEEGSQSPGGGSDSGDGSGDDEEDGGGSDDDDPPPPGWDLIWLILVCILKGCPVEQCPFVAIQAKLYFTPAKPTRSTKPEKPKETKPTSKLKKYSAIFFLSIALDGTYDMLAEMFSWVVSFL